MPHGWETRHNWAGITGLVLSILALLSAVTVVLFLPAFWLGVGAVVFSGVGISKAKIGTASNRPLSVAGMILGVLAVVASVGIILTLKGR